MERKTDHLEDSDWDMTYDALNRLETAEGRWGNGSFKYDALGNLRQKTLGSRTVTNNYSSYYNRVTSSVDSADSTRSISYDSRGNVTRLGDLDFAYDYANQPVQVSGSSSGSYKYDGNLKRVKAVVDDKAIYNIFDASGALVYVHEDKRTPYGTERKITEYVHAAGQTIARISNRDVTYIHSDHLGTPIAGTNSSGRVVWREEYTPFGEKFRSNAANDDLGSYTGHIHDSSTGLTYMQARYYDPNMGRFLSNDPIGFRTSNLASFNRYAYASNNPINRTDPTGMADEQNGENNNDLPPEEDPIEEVVVYGDGNGSEPPRPQDWESNFADDFSFGNVSNFDEDSGALESVVVVPIARAAVKA